MSKVTLCDRCRKGLEESESGERSLMLSGEAALLNPVGSETETTLMQFPIEVSFGFTGDREAPDLCDDCRGLIVAKALGFEPTVAARRGRPRKPAETPAAA